MPDSHDEPVLDSHTLCRAERDGLVSQLLEVQQECIALRAALETMYPYAAGILDDEEREYVEALMGRRSDA